MNTPLLKRYSVEERDRLREIRDPDFLSIGDALVRWCDPRRISRWQDAVRALKDFRFERRLQIEIPDPATLTNAHTLQSLWQTNERALVGECARAQDALENDLRWQFASRKLFAQGFLASGGLSQDRTLLPTTHAADFVFDPFRSIVVHGADRYLSVSVSCQPLASERRLPTEGPAATAPGLSGPLTIEGICELSDEVLLKILEAYLDRVVASPDAKLKEPGKFSLMPFIARKMRDRAQKGELLPAITTESAWLGQWIAAKIEGHPTPGAKNIGKVLGREYALLKTRSNAAIVPLKK
jgi:hypothetical protein